MERPDEADSRFSQLCERAVKYISFLVQSWIRHSKDTCTFVCDKENPSEKWTEAWQTKNKKKEKKREI